MRYAASFIFGGLGVATLWIAVAAWGWPAALQIIALGTQMLIATAAMAVALLVGVRAERRRKRAPLRSAAMAILTWAGGAYVVLNMVAAIALGAAATASETPLFANAGLAATLWIWTVGHGGYLLAVAVLAPWLIRRCRTGMIG